jgi:hypothetical protein
MATWRPPFFAGCLLGKVTVENASGPELTYRTKSQDSLRPIHARVCDASGERRVIFASPVSAGRNREDASRVRTRTLQRDRTVLTVGLRFLACSGIASA